MLKFLTALAFTLLGSTLHAADPLPSWNDTAPKQAILKFVTATTTEGSPQFIPVPQRIAVFENDGTLWSEQPVYVQAFYLAEGLVSRRHAERLEPGLSCRKKRG